MIEAEEPVNHTENDLEMVGLLAERDALREALVIAREYVADEIAYLKNAFRGHEELGRVPEAEADLARIDAALESTNAHP